MPVKRNASAKKFVDWSKVDKEDYLLAMERSPIKDMEIKVLLKGALSNEIYSRKVYANGIDQSCYYEGYTLKQKSCKTLSGVLQQKIA